MTPLGLRRRLSQALPWAPKDTLASRIALAVTGAIVLTLCLNGLLFFTGGPLSTPPVEKSELLRDAILTIRFLDRASRSERANLAGVLSGDRYFVTWYPERPAIARTDDDDYGSLRQWIQTQVGDPDRQIVFFSSKWLPAGSPLLELAGHPITAPRYMALTLADASWLVFTVDKSAFGTPVPIRVGLRIAILALSIVAVCLWSSRLFAAPIRSFAAAAERFGTDPQAREMTERGPREIRAAIRAFNAMQKRIQRFVEDRTQMIAAISHDLRTPLTRLRLRSEFVDDAEAQHKMRADLDEMEAMIESTLAFVRDDMAEEAWTSFDLPVLVYSLVDDISDTGQPVSFAGPSHGGFAGRPLALRRAVGNLIENAIAYGKRAAVELEQREGEWLIRVIDDGTGIPVELREAAFAPFFRVEASRNRHTGGTGLGLSIARSIVRAHGGDIVFKDRPAGGFQVEVSLPRLDGRDRRGPATAANLMAPARAAEP
jgi:signal transduction histidine kinase